MEDGPQDRDEFVFEEEPDETTFAQGRMPGRTYASRSFPLVRPGSEDHAEPSRFVYKVFDPEHESELVREGEEWTIRETPAGRYQFKLLVTREAGNVKELWIQRVPAAGSGGEVKNLLHLEQAEAGRLIEVLTSLPLIPVNGETSVRVDDSLVRDLFADPEALSLVYKENPDIIRMLIESDAAGKDVVAIAGRQEQVKRFRRLLEEPDYFDAEAHAAGGPEAAWQRFFEENPWIFGVSLAGQFLTSFDPDKLEQVVAGSSIAGHGKRTDALLRTSGLVRSMVFAEIKTHRASLLAGEYRPGCWRPSTELTGGVAQVQGTVHQAVMRIGERIDEVAEDGSDLPGEFTYLVRPRSYLVIGSLEQLRGEGGGDNRDQVRSFELFRRNLVEPEIITFDELLARAEWVVGIA